jgi:acetyl esterase
MELDYSRIDRELIAALDELSSGPESINRDNIISVRAAAASRPKPVVETDVSIDERAIPTHDGEVRLLIYRLPGSEVTPGILWIHGGGYILGTPTDDRARMIAEELACTVVSVDYRLAPEHPFPAGPEDCYAALLWIFENAATLKVDPTRIAIGGASAGGGMAAGLAQMNRDRDGPDLALQLLLYPMIDNLHDTISGKYVNHPVWNQTTSLNAWEMYLNGTPGREAPPYAAAAHAKELGGLPPAYICVGAEDLFRDEDIDYARRLTAAGVPTELAVFPGLYHAGDIFVPQARVSQRLCQSFLKALSDALAC